jgi:serine/threonine protein kinase
VVEPAKGLDGGEGYDKNFAMKVVDKKFFTLNSTRTNHLVNELEALKILSHPNIVHLREVINDHDDNNIYMVMQYLPGKNL